MPRSMKRSKHEATVERVKTSGWGQSSGIGYQVKCSCEQKFAIRNLAKTAEADRERHLAEAK